MAYNSEVQTGSVQQAQKKFLTKVYGWMAIALVISGIAAFAGGKYIESALVKAYYTQSMSALNGIRIALIVLAVVELGLVWWLSASIQKIKVITATIGFLVYSVVNGLTLSTIFVSYTNGTIYQAFGTAAVVFVVMAVYGTLTKSNVQSAGKYLMMGLIGIIAASLIQMLLQLITGGSFDTLSLIISIATVIVFTGLTAYDSNKMLKISEHADGSEMFEKASIIGALELYLDFINIFLALLRIFGRNRD